jgi:hypothetical protein
MAIFLSGDESTTKGQIHDRLNGLAMLTPVEQHHATQSGHFTELTSAYGMPTQLI